MPYLKTDSIAAFRAGVVPGRKVFVRTTGSDSTGDGSRHAPYQTIATGLADIRNGEGDALFIGAGVFSPGANSIQIPLKSDYAVYGVPGATFIGAPTGPSRTTFTGITRASGTRVRFTVASHSFVAGDGVLIVGITQGGTNYINGVHRVAATGATTIDVDVLPATLSNSFEPFLSALTGGAMYPLSMIARGPTNAFFDGLTFEGDLLTAEALAGFVIEGNLGSAAGRDVFISRCSMARGVIGFAEMNTTPGLTGVGTNIAMERCTVNQTLTSILQPNLIADGVGAIYLNGMTDFAIKKLSVNYQRGDVLAPAPWAPTGVIVHTAQNPSGGYAFVVNKFPTFTGITGVQQDRLFYSYVEAQEGASRIFAKQNEFTDITSIQNVSMDSQGFLVDQEPSPESGQDEVNTNSNLIMRNPTSQAGQNDGTIGQQIALLAYQGAIWIDPTNSTGKAVAGSVRNVNGLPTAPVLSWADVEALLTAIPGISKVMVFGAATGGNALDRSLTNVTVIGATSANGDSIDTGGQDVTEVQFESIGVQGAMAGTGHRMFRCTLGGITGFDGQAEDCEIVGTVALGATSTFIRCFSGASGVSAFIDLASAGNSLYVNAWLGGSIALIGLQDADDQVVFQAISVNEIILFGTAGLYTLVGDRATLTNLTTGATVLDLTSNPVRIAQETESTLGAVHGAGSWTRETGENVRSREFFASAEIDTLPVPGRFVPVGGVSHIEVEVKADSAADFSSPIVTYFIVFGYESGAISTDAPSANTTTAVAPTDGSFTSSAYSSGFPS